MKTQMILFSSEGIKYAVAVSDLSGVAFGCPFVSHTDLPDKVVGIIQWQGKIIPVVTIFKNQSNNFNLCSFLIYSIKSSLFSDIAIVVPGKVHVFLAHTLNVNIEKKEEQNGIIGIAKNDSGEQAYQISLEKLLKYVEVLPLNLSNREKVEKIAA